MIAPIGATPMYSGSLPQVAAETILARGVRPSSLALVSDMIRTAAAPSFSGHELPAVTPPPPSKASGSSESFSSVDDARGPSSLATSLPSWSFTGTISRSKNPSSCEATASSCERCAYLSMSARLTSYFFATFTAVRPMSI